MAFSDPNIGDIGKCPRNICDMCVGVELQRREGGKKMTKEREKREWREERKKIQLM